ncbi:hypothetical protein [Rhodoferax koreensis]|nr:hypothetical protein [Rhodoferax koreense]
MGSVNSISSLGGYMPSVAGPKVAPGAYEANAAQYGATTATVMGAASAIGDAVGTAYTFSAESLEKLGQAAKGGVNAVTDAVGDAINGTETAIGDAVHDVQQGIAEFGDGVSNLVHEGVDALRSAGNAIASTVESAATSVEDSVASAAGSVGDAVASVADGIGSAASSAAAYLTMGVAAGKQMLSEVA